MHKMNEMKIGTQMDQSLGLTKLFAFSGFNSTCIHNFEMYIDGTYCGRPCTTAENFDKASECPWTLRQKSRNAHGRSDRSLGTPMDAQTEVSERPWTLTLRQKSRNAHGRSDRSLGTPMDAQTEVSERPWTLRQKSRNAHGRSDRSLGTPMDAQTEVSERP